MSSRRSSNVRTKVVALLLSLAALWAFAAFVTVREGLNLLWLSTLDDNVGRPSESVVKALQKERRLTLVYLGGGRSDQRDALATQRRESDEVVAEFKRLASGSTVQLAASPIGEQRINEAFTRLDRLADGRSSIDAGRVDRTAAAALFTGMLDSVFRVYDSLGELDDKEIAKDVRTLVEVFRAQELLAQEDSLLAGALAAGEFRGTDYADFVRLVGAQRFLFTEAVAELPQADRDRYQQLVSQAPFLRYRQLEDRIVDQGRAGGSLPVSTSEWMAAIDPVQSELTDLQTVGTDAVVKRGEPGAVWVIVRLALAGVLGLIAVIASIIISITTARNLVRQLERLRNAARDLASYRLPRVVERLQHGERVDVETEAPPLDFGRDEIGQVGEAFNQVQETAVRVAVEQAELRRSVRDVFLSLARRSQALLHRQLGLLDAMERRATDSEELAELFRIDHLATRMRRNAENLIVLSGATAGRAWRKPVPMVDVLRGALAEVEDYTRVTVLPVGSASLLGRAVGDVIHLLAELIENAVSFSPPQTVVRVGGSVVGYGFAIEIEDRGLGMSPEDLEAANEQLRDPPEFRLTSTARLGLYVVGKLAERHGIKVRLTESPYGGTTAIVLLPGTLMADDGSDSVSPVEIEPEPDGIRAGQLVGVGRHRLPSDTAPATHTPVALAAEPYPGWVEGAAPNGANGSHVNGASAGSVSGAPLTAPPETPPANGAGPDQPLFHQGVSPAVDERPGGLAAPGVPQPATGPQSSGGLPIRPMSTPPMSTQPMSTQPMSTLPPSAGPLSTDAAMAPPMPVSTVAAPSEPATVSIDPPILTPAGLPWRQRVSSPGEPAPSTDTGYATDGYTSETIGAAGNGNGDASSHRGPDQTRSLMSSYRSGTLRGRNEAARLAEQTQLPPQWTDATPEPTRTTSTPETFTTEEEG